MLLGFLAQHVAMSRTLETNPYGASLPHVFFGDLAHYSEGCLTSGGFDPRWWKQSHQKEGRGTIQASFDFEHCENGNGLDAAVR